MSDASHIAVIIASTRQGRTADNVARWFFPLIEERADMTAELVDLRDFQLPYYDHVKPASMLTRDEEPREWSDVVSRADGFVFLTPEYNHSIPAVLKSALDAIYTEWNRKPMAV